MSTESFGFSENPFADGHDPRFLYPSRSHREAVAHLRRAIEGREPFALLTGLPGVGKTIAVETALAEAGPHARVTITAAPGLTREQFLERVLAGFAPGEAGGSAPPDDGIEARLRAVRAAGDAAVLVVEEAQDLSPSMLDDLRLYSNLEAGGYSLLQIVLAGRPELEETLSHPACDALRQRIEVGCRLDPLDARETEGYVRHRVAAAGGDGQSLFTSEACQALHRLTHGIPREIDRLAGEALLLADTAGEDSVVAGHVACAVMMLGFRSAAGDAAAPAAEKTAEAAPVTGGHPGPTEGIEPEAGPPVPLDDSLPQPCEEEPVARVEESPAADIEVFEAPPAAEPAATAAPEPPAPAPTVEPPPAPAPRHARRRREAPPRGRAPRAGHRARTTVLTATALLLVVAGGLVLMNPARGRERSRAFARPAVATPAEEKAAARTASVSPERPSPVPAPAAAIPAPPPAPAAASAPAKAERAPAAPQPAYAVEVATFLSESRARTERDRLAAVLPLPCHVVPSDEDGYAVVVGPVKDSREATRLSVDLSRAGSVGQARVVRWAAPGGTRR